VLNIRRNLVGICFLIVYSISQSTFGQRIDDLNFEINFGYSVSDAVDLKRVSVEPKFPIDEHFDVGMKLMYSVYRREPHKANLIGSTVNPIHADREVERYFNGALTFDYSADLIQKISPFIGVGLGLFPIRHVKITKNGSSKYSAVDYTNEYALGLLIRGGFDIGRFRAGLEYNIIKDSRINFFNPIENNTFIINASIILGKKNQKRMED